MGYICDDCGTSFTQKRELSNHLLVHAGRRLSCLQCSNTFEHIKNLERHVRIHHGPGGSSDVNSGKPRIQWSKEVEKRDKGTQTVLSYPERYLYCGTCKQYFSRSAIIEYSYHTQQCGN